MLKINATIEDLIIDADFGKAGLDASAVCLPDMRGLKSIEVLVGHKMGVMTAFTPEIGKNAFVDGLEWNTTLRNIHFPDPWNPLVCNTTPIFLEKITPKVDRLLALNRGGRQLLAEPQESALPLNYWPTLLARSFENVDVIFYFLLQKHDVLLVNSGTEALIAHLFSTLPFHD